MNEDNNIKNSIRNVYHRFGKRGISGITASSRVLPDFIIIGTVRSGSTSLYYNICEHPSVLQAAYDEIGYFDSNYHLGENWYRSMFPRQKIMDKIKNNTGYAMTGEDTPFYFWKKYVAERIFKDLPRSKMIIIFRNPVDRAFSNYNLGLRTKTEKLSFEEAIDEEMKFLEKNSFEKCANRKRSYLAKGLYDIQMNIWLNVFTKKQFHFLSTEDMQKNPKNELQNIFRFLEIPDYEIENPQKQKSEKYEKMKDNTRKMLLEFYQSHNEKLFESIGKRFDWN